MSRKNRSRKQQESTPRAPRGADVTPTAPVAEADGVDTVETTDDEASEQDLAADTGVAAAADADVAEVDATEIEVTDIEVTEIEVTGIDVAEIEVTEIEVGASDLTDVDVTAIEVDADEVTDGEVTDVDVTEIEVTGETASEIEMTTIEVTDGDGAFGESESESESAFAFASETDAAVDADADAETVGDGDALSVALGAADVDAILADSAPATEPVDEEAVARSRAASYEHLKPIIEALIFASPEPLTPKTLFKLLESEPKEDVETALALLRQDYDHPGGLQLVEVAGGYQIVTRPELHEYVRLLFHERTSSKLSVQALETLAVIAYKQPITAPEITEIRGVNTSGVLNTLIDRKLVKIVGRKNVVGRPFMYATTRDFLDKFGLNDLTDLPKVEDLADVLGFEPPSLDANEAAAETLAFDFGDPDAGGYEMSTASAIPSPVVDDAASAPQSEAPGEMASAPASDRASDTASDAVPEFATSVDAAAESEVEAESSIDISFDDYADGSVEDSAIDADADAFDAVDADENASSDEPRKSSSDEDEIL